MNKVSEIQKVLQTAIHKFPVFSFLNYCEYLRSIYGFCKESIQSFSYNDFAREMGFEETNLMWLFVVGKRKITQRSAGKIAKGLGLDRLQTAYFQALVNYNNEVDFDKKELAFRKLLNLKTTALGDESAQLSLKYFSQWYYPIIREMSALPEFQAEVEWIQAKLFFKLKKQQILDSLLLLEKLGFLQRNDEGKLIKANQKQVTTDRTSKNIALISYHKQVCELTRDSISAVPAKLRDLNTLTVSLSDETAVKARQMIHELCAKIMELEVMERNPERIYQFNLQQLALTKCEEQK